MTQKAMLRGISVTDFDYEVLTNVLSLQRLRFMKPRLQNWQFTRLCNSDCFYWPLLVHQNASQSAFSIPCLPASCSPPRFLTGGAYELPPSDFCTNQYWNSDSHPQLPLYGKSSPALSSKAHATAAKILMTPMEEQREPLKKRSTKAVSLALAIGFVWLQILNDTFV